MELSAARERATLRAPARPAEGSGAVMVARRFLGALQGARVTVRDTRGGDADAACGQLRADLEARRILRPDGTLSPPRVPARA